MTPVPTLIRILLFISTARHDEWKKDRLHQQAGLFGNETEQKHFTGQFSRYPLCQTDMFGNDRYRFVCKHDNTLADVYISFIDGLLVYDDAQRKDLTLFVIPNDDSGGIDFYRTNDKIKDIADLKLRKADWRWFPVSLSKELPLDEQGETKTCIVFHHPEKVCEMIDTGAVSIVSSSLLEPEQKHRYLRSKKDVSLTGGSAGWCEEQFTGQGNTLGIEELLEFIKDNPPF